MAISGWGIAGLAGGVLLVWSAINHRSPLTVVTDLVQGTKPQPGPPGSYFPVQSTGQPVTSSGGGLPVFGPPGQGMEANAVAILKTLSAPLTKANIQSVVNWQQREGANSYNNPLNTTLRTPGSVGTFNSAGVQEYGNITEGISATVQTLLGGGYSAIVAALRSGQGLASGYPGVGPELSLWSGGGYTSV